MTGQARGETARALRTLARGALAGLAAVACLMSITGGNAARADTLIIQVEQGAFENRLVKRAIDAAAGWHQLAESSGLSLDGVVLRAGGRDVTLPPAAPDRAGAKKLMAEAGYVGGEAVQFLLLHDEALTRLAVLAARRLAAVGLKAETREIAPGTLEATLKATRYVTGARVIELPYLLLTLERSVAPQPQRLADLVVDHPTVEYDAARRRLTVLTRVANIGDAAAGRHRLAVLDLSRTITIPPVVIEPLKAGQDRLLASTIEVGNAALGQTLILRARIDVQDDVKESNERNNQSEDVRHRLPDPAPRLPDLIVGQPDVVYDPNQQQLTVRTTVANQGDRAARAHRLASLEHGGVLGFAPVPVEAIQPGEKRSLVGTVAVPDGVLGRTLVIQVEIDAEGQVRESDESNNTSGRVRHVLPDPPSLGPDLLVGAPRVAYDAPSRRLTLQATVANRGDEAAGANQLAIVDHSGAIAMPAIPVDPLKAGERRVVTGAVDVPETALGRTLALQAEIDAQGAVAESDEGNNRSERTELRLAAPAPKLPDLVVERFSVEFDPSAGEIVIKVSVANRGEQSAAAHRLTIHDHSQSLRLPSVPVPALTPGQSRQFDGRRQVPESAFGRTLVLQAEIDSGGVVAESDETNNRSDRTPLALPGPVVPLADLVVVVLQVALDDSSRTVQSAVTVENRGDAASPPSQIALLAAPGGREERIEVPAIAPGGEWTVKGQVALAAAALEQSLTLTAVIDPDGRVPEGDEGNNRLQRTLAPLPSVQEPPSISTWPPAPTWPPNATALVIAGLATVSLIVFVWALRRGRAGRRKDPSRDRQSTAPLITYRPRSDGGSQAIERVDGEAEILFEIALRPVRDPGTQSVSRDSAQ